MTNFSSDHHPQRRASQNPSGASVVNLMDPAGDVLLGISADELGIIADKAAQAVRSGDVDSVGEIRGQFALCQQSENTIRMARTIGRPMRYFLADGDEGTTLIVAERIDEIADQLEKQGFAGNFDPADTRMVPAHYLLELQLDECPDANPRLHRFFAPDRNCLPADIKAISEIYIGKLAEICDAWLSALPEDAPIGVLFSGGIDSGSVLIVLDHLLRERGQSPSRLRAFTLALQNDGSQSAQGSSNDLDQAREFLASIDRSIYLEEVVVPIGDISWQQAIEVIEDYKPLDVQSATMACALIQEIRRRHPKWRFLIDGDGGDENLKDYPIEDNADLTIQSVLNHPMLYQEGWGVDAVKHSLTYSGGQSRGHIRTSATGPKWKFSGFSPFATTEMIEVAEGIPFVELTDWDHQKLYQLKGQVVAAGIEAITGIRMPIFEKRRFQHGVASADEFQTLFPSDDQAYRNAWLSLYQQD